MDSDCLNLLPSVCEALADPKLLLHDDTSLEKLLDCFKKPIMQSDEQFRTLCLPYLLQLLQSVTKAETVDPPVFSFSLKLAGLLAGKEHSFTLLEEGGVLEYMFQPDSWRTLELWKNSSVRYGWLQGLWNMLQHQQSMDFFCKNGFIKLVLHLQNDKGLFITSLTNKILAHVLNSVTPAVLNSSSESGTPKCCPDRSAFVSVTTELMAHLSAALASQEQAVIITALRLLAIVFTQSREPLKVMVWKHVVGPLEVLANVKEDSYTLPVMAVLQAVARSPVFLQPDYKVEALMDVMLFSRSATESVQCAAVILQVEDCHEVLRQKAIDVILAPLLCATASSLQPHEPDKLNRYISHLKSQLSKKASCASLLTQSLSSVAEHVCKKSLPDFPVQLIASSVIKLLNICMGHLPLTSVSLPEAGIFPHLIGCNKVQRCSIDLLGDLTVYAESVELMPEAFTVLLQYLQCPDSHATVLKKTHQAIHKWLRICSTSDLWRTVINELFQLMKKHVCDGRWEVRDSTLEFVTQLTVSLKGHSKYTETLHSSGMIAALFTSLSDIESYVQASAVAALGEAVTTSDVCGDVQENAVTHLLSILSEDTQGFPRRAALKVFIKWVESPHCCSAVGRSISSVLVLGGNDFDWEVKVHTLELADLLMDRSLNHCPSRKACSSESTCLVQALTTLKDLGVFSLLLKCLFDCDRPVSQKACSLLLKLRTFLSQITTDDPKVLTLEVSRQNWSEEMLHRFHEEQTTTALTRVRNGDEASCQQKDTPSCPSGSPKEMDLCQMLDFLDLEKMQHTLSLGSDHVINSPQSLMEDILFMTRESEENVTDCY